MKWYTIEDNAIFHHKLLLVRFQILTRRWAWILERNAFQKFNFAHRSEHHSSIIGPCILGYGCLHLSKDITLLCFRRHGCLGDGNIHHRSFVVSTSAKNPKMWNSFYRCWRSVVLFAVTLFVLTTANWLLPRIHTKIGSHFT